MIRVNLLQDQTARVRKVSVRPTVSRMGLVLMAVFLLLVVGLGAYWYTLDHQVQSLSDLRDRLQEENNRLQALKKKIDEYDKLKKVRESRIEVIETLKANQTGPVLLLNQVLRSIPRNASFWLTLLDQKGDRLQIAGYTQKDTAIPDFMSSLYATGFFKSVDLELLEEDREATHFTLVCIVMGKAPSE